MRSIRDRLRRPDWLAELQNLLIFGLAAVGFTAAVNVVALATGGPVVAALPAHAVDGLVGMSGGLRDGAAVAWGSTVDVHLADPGPADMLWYAGRGVPELVLILTVLALLLRLVVAARRGDPFTAATVRRLRVLGAVSAFGGVLVGLVGTVAELALSDSLTGGDTVAATFTINPVWILVGGGFVAFGEIVNRGRALRAELDTVI
ncbi:hypothetical protein GCM10009682_29850 [Luedemannella flava]|uniref:DUF2975 domain-containing protein n=1 Tax=Luedemannella flava TaxID=349316 RepID=A0ABP4Y7D7_9ACTN